MNSEAKPDASGGKGEETRSRILTAALDLFRRQGFAETTMREIAAEAGVALGSAYYYFDSKEALVLAFYERASHEMNTRIEAMLAGQAPKSLEKRLAVILDVKFEYFAPNRLFLGALSGHAADPSNPLSPFSKETRHIRERDLQHFASALQGSRLAVPRDLAPHLPKLLWLYQMGLILFWIYDRSARQQRTQLLREKSLVLVASALRFVGFPLLRPLRKRIVDLVQAVEGDANDE
jgi:AcrR family transcriptional regulator